MHGPNVLNLLSYKLSKHLEIAGAKIVALLVLGLRDHARKRRSNHRGNMESAPKSGESNSKEGPWWRELTRYHWWVLIVAALGWLFDTMDQRIFILARSPALKDLLPSVG